MTPPNFLVSVAQTLGNRGQFLLFLVSLVLGSVLDKLQILKGCFFEENECLRQIIPDQGPKRNFSWLRTGMQKVSKIMWWNWKCPNQTLSLFSWLSDPTICQHHPMQGTGILKIILIEPWSEREKKGRRTLLFRFATFSCHGIPVSPSSMALMKYPPSPSRCSATKAWVYKEHVNFSKAWLCTRKGWEL